MNTTGSDPVGHTASVETPDIALVLPVEGDRVHLVEQYRHPVAGRRWEFPSGSADAVLDADAATLAEVERMIRDGVLTDAKSTAAYALLLLHERP